MALGVQLTRPRESNAIFARFETEQRARLLESYFFYPWDETRQEVRWMTSFDTTEADVDAFVNAIQSALTNSADPKASNQA